VDDSINQNSKKYREKKLKISGIEMTSDRLTDRGGASMLVLKLVTNRSGLWCRSNCPVAASS
jgi:hypothetical protein